MKEKYFVLELHDIAPCFMLEFEKMLEWAKGLEAEEPVVLITPKWPQGYKPEEIKEFIHKIKELKAKIVLHGFTHFAPPSFWDRIWYGVESGAEFKKAGREKASLWLSSGKTVLEEWTRQKVDWFCAPRWQMKKGTIYALKREKFRGYLAHRHVLVFNGPKITVPAVSFDHGKRKPVCALNRLLRQVQVKKYVGAGKPFRLALHPRDFKNRAVLEELDNMVGMMKSAAYKPRSFDQMIGE